MTTRPQPLCGGDPACIYCDRPFTLTVRHEHDHIPIPWRHGGEQTACVCRECHSLKDRMGPRHWPVDEFFGAGMDIWKALSPRGRIVYVWMAACMCDMAEIEDQAREAVKTFEDAK